MHFIDTDFTRENHDPGADMPILSLRNHKESIRAQWLCAITLLIAVSAILPGCGEVTEFPKESKAAIEAGWTFYAVSEFDRSEAAFTHAAANATPGSHDYFMAKFGLANAYQHRKPTPKTAEAKVAFEEIANEDKGGEIGGWSALALARIDHMKLYDVDRPGGVAESTSGEYLFVLIMLLSVGLAVGAAYLLKDNYRLLGIVALIAILVGGLKLGNWMKVKPDSAEAQAAPAPEKATANLPKEEELAAVRAKYQRVMTEFATTTAAEEATVFYGETMIEMLADQQVKDGIAYLKKWAEAHPDSLYISAAYSQMANGYEMLDLPREQLQAMLKADETNRDPASDRAWGYYRIASIADKRAGEPELARKFYRMLIEKYPTDLHLFNCKQALKRLDGPAKKEAAQP
jgi:tetratricopeptide (TPR) repeat protein